MEAAVYNQKGLKVGDRKVWHKVQQLIQKRAALFIEFPDWFKNIVPYVRSDNLWARRYFPAFLQACRTVALIRSFCRKQRMGRKARRIIVRFSDFAVTALIFNPVFEHSIDKADDQDLETRHYVDRLSFRKGGNGVRANDLADEKDIFCRPCIWPIA